MCSPFARSRSAAPHRRVATQVRKALAPTRGTSLLKVDLGAAERAVESLPTVAERTLRPRVPPQPSRRRSCPNDRLPSRGRAPIRISWRGAAASSLPSIAGIGPALARIWVKRDVELRPGAFTVGDLRIAVAAVSPLAGSRFPGRVSSVTTTPEALTLRLRSGLEIRLGDPADVPLKLAVAAARDPSARGRYHLSRRRRARTAGLGNPQLSGRG